MAFGAIYANIVNNQLRARRETRIFTRCLFYLEHWLDCDQLQTYYKLIKKAQEEEKECTGVIKKAFQKYDEAVRIRNYRYRLTSLFPRANKYLLSILATFSIKCREMFEFVCDM